MFLLNPVRIIMRLFGYNTIDTATEVKNVKKVPKHIVIAFRGAEASENGILLLVYRSCLLFKLLNIDYVTIFEPNGIAESKLTVFLNNRDELPKNLRFLSKKDSSQDFFEKIQDIVNKKCTNNEGTIFYKELYGVLNSGGDWPTADCILFLRNMPFDIPINGFDSIAIILRRLREYLASNTPKIFKVASTGPWGDMPLVLAQHSEIL
ncbi:hypothetical protein FG379_001095 [Cryptosporidium bovis]|uniref:uncharacterized protein n=1 Tax=Cryptosporidium bovis TaxID=310047 RepID=UPI00351A6408|nr:hypothetical protein FG379_001095 [Cryptosporidium bovis]